MKSARIFLTQRGFTLIEMLTVLSMVVIIAGAMAALLFSAFRVIKALDSKKYTAISDSMIALEKISHEIAQSPVYPPIAFEGGPDRLSFPKISVMTDKSPLEATFRLGQIQQATLGSSYSFRKVSYFFDKAKKTLMRQVDNGNAEVVLNHLEELNFFYALRPHSQEQWLWSSQTPSAAELEEIGALRIRLKLAPEFSDRSLPFIEKTFWLSRVHPMGSLLLAEEEAA